MTKRRSLSRAVAGWLCLLTLAAVGRGGSAAKDWPVRLGERRLHTCAHGVVYARQKGSVEQVRKALAAVAKDATGEGLAAPGAGLILVVDAKEKYPCDVAKLIATMKTADPNAPGRSCGEGLQKIAEAEKGVKDLGLEMDVMLALAPVSIPLDVLPDVLGGLPAEAVGRIEWCVVVPTDSCMKAAFKKTIDAALKKEKPGLAERVTLAALMPLVERKAVAMMKKGRQAGLYAVFVNAQKNLSPEQKRRKTEAYKEKLGLNQGFDPTKGPDEPDVDPPESE